MSDRGAERVLQAWTERLAPLETERSLAWWEANLAAGPETTARLRAALAALVTASCDAEGFERVKRSLEEPVSDPTLRRALEVLRLRLLPFQVPRELRLRIADLEASVQERFARTRGRVGGRDADDNEIAAVLRDATDGRAREEAWCASKEVGAAVADDVRRLARLRNESARALGHRDFRSLSLAAQEVDPAWLDGFLDATEAGTRAPFAAYKAALDGRLARRFGVAASDLRPWHHEDPFFQQAPTAGGPSLDAPFAELDLATLTTATFDAIGFDVRPALARSDLFPRAGKCQHAFCTHVDREGDVRVLCNVVPGVRWMSTMLHEFGHAIYDLSIDRRLPWVLRRPPHASSTEAVAMLFGRLARDPEWLASALDLSGSRATEIGAAARTSAADSMLVFVRWTQVMTRFERALYEDPEQDLDAVWWGLVERFQGVARVPGRRAPDWAAKIHVATTPVYYHAYLMGECTASQLLRHVRSATGRGLVGNADAGAWLRDAFFAPGSRRPWDAHLAAATGGPLDPTLLLGELTAA